MNKDTKLPDGTLTLVLLSVIIASSFIILIYTQTNGIKGLNIELDSIYGQRLEVPICSDFTGDNVPDLVIMVKPHHDSDKIYNVNYGMVKLYNTIARNFVWSLDLKAPPINVYKVFDYDGDGVNDLFLTYGTPNETSSWNDEINYYPGRFGNSFISGSDGSYLKIGGSHENLTNNYISDFLIYDDNFTDNIEDFVVIRLNSIDDNSQSNITAYFWNGTICKNYQFINSSFYDLKIINYLSKKQILAISHDNAFVLNTSTPNNYSIILKINETADEGISYLVLDDLNNDNCSELLLITQNKLKLISGLDGAIINYLNLSSQSNYFEIKKN
ncbi:MAG: hypothetical protein ACTSVV_06150 [Promethearchaeota archaeon]